MVAIKIKEYVEAYDLVDQGKILKRLFPSTITGNIDKAFNRKMRGLFQFCALIQDWISTVILDSDHSTEHFPFMDPDTIALCFDCNHNDR